MTRLDVGHHHEHDLGSESKHLGAAARKGGHFLDVVKLGGQCRAEDGMQILEPLSPDSVVGEVREVPSLVSLVDPSGGRPAG